MPQAWSAAGERLLLAPARTPAGADISPGARQVAFTTLPVRPEGPYGLHGQGSLPNDRRRLTVAFGRGADIGLGSEPVGAAACDPKATLAGTKSRTAVSPPD